MSERERRSDAEARGRARRGKGEGPADAEDRERPSALAEWTKSILIAGVLFLVLRTFLIQTFVITSGSMENTLLVGDFLVVNRAAIGSRVPFTDVRIPGYSEPRLGDVLVFDPHHEPDLKLVKRLVGMEGDTLEMRRRVLYRNGEALEEPYVKHADVRDESDPRMAWQVEHLAPGVDPATYRPTRDAWGPLVVPEGHVFMLGDHRERSLDSRYWGPLAEWRLEGRAVFIYYSYDQESYRPFPAVREIRWSRLGDLIR